MSYLCVSKVVTAPIAWMACEPERVAFRHYHASMSVEERERTQYDWSRGRVQIIAATIAFGMGDP